MEREASRSSGATSAGGRSTASVPRSGLCSLVRQHLEELVVAIGPRPPGSPGNARAASYVRDALGATGLTVREDSFVTRWWEPGEARLVVDGVAVPANPCPYSAAGSFTGPLVRISDPKLTPHPSPDSILVLEPGVPPAPVMPRAFPFYQPPEDRAFVEALEAMRPTAVVVVAAGPPLFEDPDLAFPVVTVAPEHGIRLRTGALASLKVGGLVHEGLASTISGRTDVPGSRVVVSAHLDSKVTTPGAFDNAGGVAAVLAWAQLGLPQLPVEIVFFNGEDHFDAGGEQAWLAATEMAEVVGNINIDGAGVVDRGVALSFLAASPELELELASYVGSREGWAICDPWFESDHAVFAMLGKPAVAITSIGVHDLMEDIAHTPRDDLRVVDPDTLADVAESLNSLVGLVERVARS